MADNIFRAFPPFPGGSARWVATDPAGDIAREGFFGPPDTGGGGGSASVAATLLTSGGDTADNQTSVTTASVAWDAGDMIVVALDMCYNSGDDTAWACTASGLTFTLQLSVANGNYQRNHVFTAVAGSAGSGAISLTGPVSYVFAYQVIRLRPTNATLAAGTGQSGSTSTGATNSLGSLTGYDSDDYQLAVTMIGDSQTTGSYAAMAGTPRAGWTEIGETVFARTGGSANWSGFVHSQLGPQGGENTASVADLYAYAVTRMLVLPVEVTATGGGGSSLKVWTGSAFVAKPAKVWTGSAWVEKPVKTWSGSAWV